MPLWARIILYVLLLIALTIFGFWLYLFKLGGIEGIVNGKIAELLDPSHHVEVTIGELSGSYFDDLTISEITAYYVNGDDKRLILHVPSVSASYKLSSLFGDEVHLKSVSLLKPSVLLYQDSAGKLLLPEFGGKGTGEGGGSEPPTIAVDHIGIEDGNFRFFQPRDTLTADSIDLGISLAIAPQMISVGIDHLRMLADTFDIRTGSGKNALTYAQKSLVAQGVSLLVNQTRLGLDGVLSLKDTLSGMADFTASNLDVGQIADLLGAGLTGVLDLHGNIVFNGSNLNGEASVSGSFMDVTFDNLYFRYDKKGDTLRFDTLYGSVFDNCTIDGRGEIRFVKPDEEYNLTAHIQSFDLAEVIHNDLHTDLNGTVDIEGSSFRESDLLLRCDVDIFESSFDEYPLHEAYGRLIVTVDSLLLVDSFRVNYFENSFTASGKIDYSDDIDLSVYADLPVLARYNGKLFLEEPAGRAKATVRISGKTENPDLDGTLISDSLWCYDFFADTASVTFALPHFVTHESGRIAADMFSGSAWGVNYDTLRTSFSLDSGVVLIDSLFFRNTDMRMQTRGSYSYDQSPQWLLADTLALTIFDRNFSADEQIAVAVDSSGFTIRQAKLQEGNSIISATGAARYDRSMDLSVHLQNAPIARWLSLYDSTIYLDGDVSGEMFLSGTTVDPKFLVAADVDSLVYDGVSLGKLSVSARYADQLLTLDSSRLDAPKQRVVATGHLPCDLSFRSGVVERFPDEPLDLSIYAVVDSLSDIAEALLPSIEEFKSVFVGDLSVTGTTQRPILQGSGLFVGTDLKYFDLADRIHADTARIQFSNDRIIVDSVRAYVNVGKKRKYALIDGTIRVPAIDTFVYDVHVVTDREFPVRYELADIRGKVQADLRIVGPTPPSENGEITTVVGDVFVHELTNRTDFAEPGGGAELFDAIAGEQSWNMNIVTTFPDKLRIVNRNLDGEFSGELTFIREQGRLRPLGTMEVERGRAYLFDKTFRLDQGGTATFDGTEGFNPTLNLVARTRIPSASTSTADVREDLELAVQITGTLDAPEFNTVEGSQFSKEDIVPLLVANYYAGDTAGYQGNLEGRVSNVLSAQLSQFGARTLGVETFQIEAGEGGVIDPTKSRVTVGSSLQWLPNLYIYGSSNVSLQGGEEVGFEYRFTRSVLLEGRRDELELFHLNLTLHWDF